MTESTLFGLAFILYIVATLFYLAFQFSKKEDRAKVGFALASLGFLSHTAALILRTFESHHAPFTNMYESLSFLAWASALAFLVIDRKFKIPRIGAYVLLIVVGLVALASSPLNTREIEVFVRRLTTRPIAPSSS